MKVVKGWGGFHLWRVVQGGAPKGGQPSIAGIDCGERGREIARSEGERLRGAMRSVWNFPTVKCGREIEVRDFVTVASLKM